MLEAPAPVAAVAPTQAAGAVPIEAGEQAKLDAMVAQLHRGRVHPRSAQPGLHRQGQGHRQARRRRHPGVRGRLEPPARQAPGRDAERGTDGDVIGQQVAPQPPPPGGGSRPSKQGDLLSPHKLLGILPFGAGDRLRDYFEKYRSSQHELDSIITALYHGQDELQRDNAAIEQEKVNLWTVMGRLRQYAYLAQKLDEALSARIAAVEATDPERAKVLKEDMLFSIRQKHQDLLTQLAVSVQGYLALDVIRRNNVELIKGVQRATTTTVSALRTAVIVAQALADQKLVLDQITALNTTTSNLIESTSELLHQQSGAINQQAASSTVELEKLQAAFTNIYATMDEIDTFKVAALDTMQKTVTALSTEIAKSQQYLDRVRADETRGPGTAVPGSELS